MSNVEKRVADIRGVDSVLIHNGKVLDTDELTVGQFVADSEPVFLLVDKEKRLYETTSDLKKLREMQREECLRRWEDEKFLQSIEPLLSDAAILAGLQEAVKEKKTLPDDIMTIFREACTELSEILEGRSNNSTRNIQMFDAIAVNHAQERDAINLYARVQTMAKVISRMEKHKSPAVESQRKKSFFGTKKPDDAQSLNSMAENRSFLNSLIKEARDLISGKTFNGDLKEGSEKKLDEAEKIIADLKNKISEAKSPSSINLDEIKRCIDDLLTFVEGVRAIVTQATNEFLDNEILKQLWIQDECLHLMPENSTVCDEDGDYIMPVRMTSLRNWLDTCCDKIIEDIERENNAGQATVLEYMRSRKQWKSHYDAIKLLDKCHSVKEKCPGKDTHHGVTLLNDLANCHYKLGDFYEADRIFQIVLGVQSQVHTDQCLCVADTHYNLARCHTDWKKFNNAEKNIKLAIGVYEAKYPDNENLPKAKAYLLEIEEKKKKNNLQT